MGVELDELLMEIRDIKSRVEKLENIVERRLVGEDDTFEDERSEITGYEERKARGELDLLDLEEAMKSFGVQSTGRKKGL